MRRVSGGFTLVELVVVMIVVSAGLLGIVTLFGNNISALVVGEDNQRAAQYGQECAERVLAVRQIQGFDSVNIATTMCDSLTLPGGFVRTVAVPATYTGTTTTACPNLATCRDVTVTVTKGSASSVTAIMLASY